MNTVELLPLNRAARRFGVGPGWLKGEVLAGRLPGLQAGNKFIFNAEALGRALSSRASGNGNPSPTPPTETLVEGVEQ